MSKIVEIHLPDEIAHYEGDLRYFFDSMIRKLYANRHRGFAEDADLGSLMSGLFGEIDELVAATKMESQFNAYMEAVDTAIYAFLIGLFLSRLTKRQYEELKQ